jgi:hypothetical protein
METATKTPRKVAASIGRASTTRAGLAMAARFPQAGDPDLARVCSLLQRAGSRAFTLGVEGCNGPPGAAPPQPLSVGKLTLIAATPPMIGAWTNSPPPWAK